MPCEFTFDPKIARYRSCCLRLDEDDAFFLVARVVPEAGLAGVLDFFADDAFFLAARVVVVEETRPVGFLGFFEDDPFFLVERAMYLPLPSELF